MRNFFRRLKNLWEISEYRVNAPNELMKPGIATISKDFPTIKKKPATIIKPVEDFFETPEDEIRES